MSPSDHTTVCCSTVMSMFHRTDKLIRSYLNEMTTEVLFGLNPHTRLFPLSRVAFLHAKRSPWMTVVARYAIEDKRLELLKQGLGENLRPVYFKDVEWANHFVSK